MQAMFGWVGNHTSGLFADEQEVIADADMSGEKSIEDKYARQSGTVPSSSALGMSLYVLLQTTSTQFIVGVLTVSTKLHTGICSGLHVPGCIGQRLINEWLNEGMMNMTCYTPLAACGLSVILLQFAPPYNRDAWDSPK